MSISAIGLQGDIASRRGDAAAPEPHAKPLLRHRPAPTAATHPVTLDLPDPMPGRLQLDVDRESGRVIGRIIDKDTGRLIRQIPSDEALRLAASVEGLIAPLYDGRA